MDMQFKRILDLVRRTGDRMVITDPNGQDAYVVMDLDQYEDLIDAIDYLEDDYLEDEAYSDDFEEIEPIGRIDQAMGSSEMYDEAPLAVPDEISFEEDEDFADLSEDSGDTSIWDALQSADESGPTWNLEELKPEEQKRVAEEFHSLRGSEPATETEEETSAQLSEDDDDDLGEEQFYLEPVE